MRVEKIKLKNFRNYDSLELSGFSENINILCGKNAQGKTNLIEALNYLSSGKSFRDFSDARLVQNGKNSAYLGIEYQKNIPSKIDAVILNDGRKSIKLNGIPIKKLSDLLGSFYTVVFSPEDINTVKESPGLRRRFLDIELSKIYPSYCAALQKYNEILKSKNKILKFKNADKALIEVYNSQLAAQAEIIIRKRDDFIASLNCFAGEIHSAITEKNEAIEIVYKASADRENIRESLLKKYEKNMERELETGITLSGPHREDFDIAINGSDVKLFGSQGQQRTAILSIKLAAVEIIKENTGYLPVVLLDDVFSELDEFRRKSVLKAVKDAQVFITTAQTKWLKTINAAIFEVDKAIISRIS